MSCNYEEPKVTKVESNTHKEVQTHPSYGMIGVSRISGGNLVLNGSDFIHNRSIAIRIKYGELLRDSASEHHYAGSEIVEVYMSEAQWATFVSSMNIGEGVPCTLTRVMGKSIPMIPKPRNRAIQFTDAVKERLEKSREALEALSKSIDDTKISIKLKKELQDLVREARVNIGSNLNFVATQFGEHIEKNVESAKMEVSAFIHNAITHAGLEALGVPIQVPDMKMLEE